MTSTPPIPLVAGATAPPSPAPLPAFSQVRVDLCPTRDKSWQTRVRAVPRGRGHAHGSPRAATGRQPTAHVAPAAVQESGQGCGRPCAVRWDPARARVRSDSALRRRSRGSRAGFEPATLSRGDRFKATARSRIPTVRVRRVCGLMSVHRLAPPRLFSNMRRDCQLLHAWQAVGGPRWSTRFRFSSIAKAVDAARRTTAYASMRERQPGPDRAEGRRVDHSSRRSWRGQGFACWLVGCCVGVRW